MTHNEKDTNLDNILKELHKVLDEITLEIKTEGSLSQDIENKKEKIESLKSALKSSFEKTELETKSDKIPTVELQPSSVNQQLNVEQQVGENKNILQEPVSEQLKDAVISPTQTQQKSEFVPQQESSVTKVNTVLIYPQSIPETESLFLENITSTLKRVCKKPISLELVWKLQYTDVNKDLILQYPTILDQIKSLNTTALFIVETETTSLEEFISKISPFVLLTKVIKFSELKMKSVYLDIAIDMLLAIK